MDFVPASMWDPGDSTYQSMYAVGPGGIYHTSDMGQTWTHRDGGMDNLNVSRLAIAHLAPDILYATTGFVLHKYFDEQPHVLPGSGVYRSGDRGQSWERLPLSIEEQDMKFLNAVVTSSKGDSVVVASHRRIMRSVDHGKTWEEVHLLDEIYGRWDITGLGAYEHFSPHIELYVAPTDFSSLIAVRRDATWAFGGYPHRYEILHSLDGGATWADLEIDGRSLRQLPASWEEVRYGPPWPMYTVEPGTMWAVERGGVYRSTDYGATWAAVPIDDPDSLLRNFGRPNPLAADNFITSGLAVFRDGVLSVEEDSRAYGGLELGHSQPSLEDSHGFSSISFHRHAPVTSRGLVTAFNNAQVKAVCKLPQTGSGDNGAYRYVATSGKNNVMVGSASSKVGHAWHALGGDASRGYLLRGRMAEWVLCHPTKPHHALVAQHGGYARSATQAAEADSWVYYHDSQWVEDNYDNVPNVRTHIGYATYAMDTAPAHPDRVFAVTAKGVFRSDDWADTWTQLLGEPDVNSSAGGKFIHVSRANPDHIITQRAVSHDGGETWEDLQYFSGGTGPHYDWVEQERTIFRTYGYHLGPGNPHDTRHEFPWQLPGWIKMATHPGAPDHIWTCTPLEIRRWTEDLTSYTTLATAEDLGVCRDILVMDSDPNWFWVGTDRGIWESLDGGDTWHPASRGLPPVPVSSFDVAEGQVIVGTLGRGVFSVLQAEVEALRTSSERSLPLPDRNAFALTPNWPNPFNRATTIGFTTAQAAPVRIEVYDVTGRKVSVLTDRIYAPGRHNVDWQAGPQSSGVYFVRMLADGRQVDTRRMVLRK